MSKRAAVFLLIVFLAGVRSASPCGDKFVAFGRGVRFTSAFAAAHPANVLVYMKPGSDVAAADRRYQFVTRLKLVGHRLAIVPTEPELRDALRVGRYDLIITDVSDVSSVQAEVRTTQSNSTVVPVVYNPTREQLGSASKQYGRVISAAGRDPRFYSVIDDAMRSRLDDRGPSNKMLR